MEIKPEWPLSPLFKAKAVLGLWSSSPQYRERTPVLREFHNLPKYLLKKGFEPQPNVIFYSTIIPQFVFSTGCFQYFIIININNMVPNGF